MVVLYEATISFGNEELGSRLLAEESASRMWYKDLGFLATGDPNDSKGKTLMGV